MPGIQKNVGPVAVRGPGRGAPRPLDPEQQPRLVGLLRHGVGREEARQRQGEHQGQGAEAGVAARAWRGRHGLGVAFGGLWFRGVSRRRRPHVHSVCLAGAAAAVASHRGENRAREP
jgi:hypothetical protein